MATVKKMKKAQAGSALKPTYKNLRMGVANKRIESGNRSKDGFGASKEDSAFYRAGFNRGVKGEKEYPGEPPVQKMGRWEGQNAAKKAATKKPVPKNMKSGGKAFPDLTGDGKVTRADILKGRGVIKKSGGKMKSCKYGC